jgi:molecular chaperone DnaJ
MATTERDYYELLGVPRGADEKEIKRAFRQLAREVHPDVSDAPDAEERFKGIVEAYEVLSKPETRELYDRFGHAGLRSGGYQPSHFDFGSLTDLFSAFFGDDVFVGGGRRGRQRGGDVAAQVEIELVEAAVGVRRQVPVEVAVGCDVCGGGGAKPGTLPTTCPTCGGHGRIQQVSRSVFGEFVRTQACGRCGGRGQVVQHPCDECGGDGLVVRRRTLDVDIPAGIHDGQRIRLSGEGHSALGGRAGDLYVLVRVRQDRRFAREGNDIFSTVDLTMIQAALGATVTVPTLDGDEDLVFEPGTQPGESVVLRGRGMPVLQGYGRGDHRVLVNVSIPRRLTPEQRSALETFEQHSGEDTYRTDEGFFQKLKSAFR